MNIVLLEPEIPPNTGNVARLCAATQSTLHLVEPLGFKLDDKQLRRAGMDYWKQVRWHKWKSWSEFKKSIPASSKLWIIESNGPQRYDEASISPEDYLVFGRETLGVPPQIIEDHKDHWLRIPMFNRESRSLNLSNCAALVMYEVLRQNGFPNEIVQD